MASTKFGMIAWLGAFMDWFTVTNKDNSDMHNPL